MIARSLTTEELIPVIRGNNIASPVSAVIAAPWPMQAMKIATTSALWLPDGACRPKRGQLNSEKWQVTNDKWQVAGSELKNMDGPVTEWPTGMAMSIAMVMAVAVEICWQCIPFATIAHVAVWPCAPFARHVAWLSHRLAMRYSLRLRTMPVVR